MLSPSAYEVVVLGGGPAACATALALSTLGVQSLLLVAGHPVSSARMSESIPPETGALLKRLGVCDRFLQDHQPYFGTSSSWGNSELRFNDFIFNPFGNGWHLNRNRFDQYLLRQVVDRGIEVQIGSRFIESDVLADDGYSIHLVNSARKRILVRAKFVVDATGLKAAFVRQFGLKRLYFDSLICLSCAFEIQGRVPTPTHTLVVAEEYGWWYAAASTEARIVVALVSDPKTIRAKSLKMKNVWLSKVNENRHLKKYLSHADSVDGPLQFRPAPSFLSDRVCGHSWLSVGDAASTFDPLSSQGVYKALSDGLAAGKAIANHLRGNMATLADYEAALIKRFYEYVEIRNSFYATEGRWKAASFWRTREQRASLNLGQTTSSTM